MTARKGSRCLGFVVAFSFPFAAVSVCPAENLEFALPEKSVAFPADFAAGLSVPRWINGRMVSVRSRLNRGDPMANVHVYDANGRKIYEARVLPPDAARATLLDMAVSRDGEVAVLGVANDRSGQPAYFFAVINPSGVAGQPVGIQPFEGQRATFGPDGTLWILGWELGAARRFDPAVNHATLRRFALDGKVLGEYLPWSSFGSPATQHPALGGKGGRPELLASEDRIVVISGCNQVVELTPQGEILRRVSLLEQDLLPPFAAAITSDNGIYLKRHPGSFSICRLQLDDGRCDDIPGAERFTLIGAEGQALVLQSNAMIEWRRAVE